MPLIVEDPTPAPKPSVKPVAVSEPAAFKGTVVDNKVTPVNALMAYLDGASWTTQYLRAVIGKHNDLRQFDAGMNNVNQSYELIKDFQLRVTTPLTSSFDQESGKTTVQGTANVLPLVPVNMNDMFLAEAGERRDAWFRVTRAERKQFNNESVYEIDYVLYKYRDDNDPEDKTLLQRIIRTFVFRQDRLIEGSQPILQIDDDAIIRDLDQQATVITHWMLDQFGQNPIRLLLVPDQGRYLVHDALVQDLLNRLSEEFDHPTWNYLRSVALDTKENQLPCHVFQLMLERNWRLHSRLHPSWGAVWARSWPHHNGVGNIRYCGADAVMRHCVDGELGSTLGLLVDKTYDFSKPTYTSGTDIIPLIHPIDPIGNYYVFSKAFYENDGANMSLLEILVRDYVKRQTLDIRKLKALTDDYMNWPSVEQFYYGAVLVLLCKEASRSIRS